MDYAKCYVCESPVHPLVIGLLLLALVFILWKGLRRPRPPAWSLTGRRRRRG